MPQVFDIGDRVRVEDKRQVPSISGSRFGGTGFMMFTGSYLNGGVSRFGVPETFTQMRVGIVTDRWLDENSVYRVAVQFSENDAGVFEATQLTKLPALPDVTPEKPIGIIDRLLGRK